MKLVIFSDLHLHNFRDFNKVPDGRLITIGNCLKEIVDYAKTIDAPILFGGDLTQIPGMIPTKVSRMLKHLDSYTTYNGRIVYYISGNHDHAVKHIGQGKRLVTSLNVMGNNWLSLDDSPFIGSDVPCIFGIPHYDDMNLFHARLEAVAEEATPDSILMIHQTPSGISNSNIPGEVDPHSPLFDKFSLVLCGHIHKHEQLTDKFWVVGSPLHHDLGDKGQKKGFLVYDTDTRTMERILTNYPEFRTKPAGEPDPDDFHYYVEIPSMIQDVTTDQEFYATTKAPGEVVLKYCQDMGVDEKRTQVGYDLVKRL